MKILFLTMSFIALALMTGATFAEDQFHLPETDVEKRLDDILQLAAQDGGLRDYLLNRPYREKENDATYAAMVTPELAQATASFERDLVRKECGGHYSENENCGYDRDPVTCSQDTGDNLYETQEETGGAALILATYQDMTSTKGYRKYRLIRQDGVWVVDGIYCYNADNAFNWK